MLTVGISARPKETPLGRAALSMKHCSKARGAAPVPAEPSAFAEWARGEGRPCAWSRGVAPASAFSSLHLRSGQGAELLLTPFQPLLLGDRDGAGRRLRGCQACGGPQANLPAFLHDPALVVGLERRVLVVSFGSREVEPSGSNTRVGTALRRTATRKARATARAAMSVDTPTAGLLRAAGTLGRTSRGTRRHRSCRTTAFPVVAGRRRAVDPPEITHGVGGVGGSTSTRAATGLSASRRRRRWRSRQAPGRTSRRREKPTSSHGRMLPWAGRVHAPSSRGTRRHEAALLTMAKASLSEQHPVPRPRCERGGSLAAKALRGRGGDPRPTTAIGVAATPRVALGVAAGHTSPVMKLPPTADGGQRPAPGGCGPQNGHALHGSAKQAPPR